MSCGQSFLFQGSSYVESINAQYKRLCIDTKIRMARVAEEIHRYFEKKRLEDKRDNEKVRFRTQPYVVTALSLGMSEASWNDIIHTFTNFAVEQFIQKSIPLSSNYSFMPTLDEDLTQEHLCLKLRKKTMPSRESVVYFRTNGPIAYSCSWFRDAGIPCAHIVRSVAYAREHVNNINFVPSIKGAFHKFWRRRGGGTSLEDISRLQNIVRLETKNNIDDEDGERKKVNEEKEAQNLWSNGHATWNFMHRRVRSKGIPALRKLDVLMAMIGTEVCRIGSATEFDPVAMVRRLMVAVESRYNSMEPQTIVPTLQDAEKIENANAGNPRGRGTKKRTRSADESRRPRKRDKKGNKCA